MQEDYLKQLEDIKSQIDCAKKYRCTELGFHEVCKAKDIGAEHYLQCLEALDIARQCKFTLSYGEIYLCKCAVRVYIEKHYTN